jgi:hypothetical protein
MACIAAGPLGAQAMRSYTVARPLPVTPAPLRATIDFGAGRVAIRSGVPGQLYAARFRYDAERFAPIQRYDARTGILHLGLETVGGGGIRVTSRQHLEQQATITFAPGVPFLLEANLGASDATIDLGGLQLAAVTIRSSASSSVIDVSSPTTGTCRLATFSIGAGELEARQLADAGCEEVRVEGGVGRAVLDFRGSWRRDARVVAELAMGTLTLRVPRGVGVRIDAADRFLSRLQAEGLTRNGDAWTTPGFDAATHHLRVVLTTNVAGVAVEWVEP